MNGILYFGLAAATALALAKKAPAQEFLKMPVLDSTVGIVGKKVMKETGDALLARDYEKNWKDSWKGLGQPKDGKEFAGQALVAVKRYSRGYGEHGFGYIEAAFLDSLYDCENISTRLFFEAGQFGFSPSMLFVDLAGRGHVVVCVDGYVLDYGENGLDAYPRSEIGTRYGSVYWETSDEDLLSSFFACMNRGHEYRSVLDFGNARKMYEAAAKIAPYVPAPHYFLYLVTMQSDKAFSRKEYAKFVALGSGKIRNPEKHCKAGLELIASGQYASAVIELERALRLDPENEQANSALLDAYGKLGYSRIWRGEIGWGETAGIAPGLKVKFAGMTGNRPYCGTFALGRSDGKMEASVYVQSGEWARTSLNGTEYVLVCHAIESHMDGSDSALVSVLQKN